MVCISFFANADSCASTKHYDDAVLLSQVVTIMSLNTSRSVSGALDACSHADTAVCTRTHTHIQHICNAKLTLYTLTG
jgi:hypothetical protein